MEWLEHKRYSKITAKKKLLGLLYSENCFWKHYLEQMAVKQNAG